MCQNTQFTKYTASRNVIIVESSIRSSSLVGEPCTYTLTFTTTTKIPAGGSVKIVLPMDQVLEDSGFKCFPVISGVTSTTNSCTKVTASDSSTYEINLTE